MSPFLRCKTIFILCRPPRCRRPCRRRPTDRPTSSHFPFNRTCRERLLDRRIHQFYVRRQQHTQKKPSSDDDRSDLLLSARRRSLSQHFVFFFYFYFVYPRSIYIACCRRRRRLSRLCTPCGDVVHVRSRSIDIQLNLMCFPFTKYISFFV